MSRILDLSNYTPIASGGRRWIYEVPEYPGMIIKVDKTGADAQALKFRKRLIMKLFPKTTERSLNSEVQSYITFHLNKSQAILDYLPQFYGLAQTTKGIGILYEKLVQTDGSLAPTLVDLHNQNAFTNAQKDALNQLVKMLLSERIVVNDMHARNIVWANDQCFIIDGLGDRNLIPIRSLSKTINRYKYERKFRIVAKCLNLKWDEKAKQFV